MKIQGDKLLTQSKSKHLQDDLHKSKSVQFYLDDLFKRIKSPASKLAADALFEAKEDELNSAYED